MFRIITILGAFVALASLFTGSLTRLWAGDLLFGVVAVQTLHVHIAHALGVVPVLLLLLSWQQSSFRSAAFTASTILLAGIALQIMLGINVLKHPDFPILRIGHLLIASIILAVIFWLYLRAKAGIQKMPQSAGPFWFARFGMVLVILEIALGGWVSVSQAGMACFGFPDCNAQWWPAADFQGAVKSLLNQLTIGQHQLSFEVQVAVNWLHRFGAFVCFILLNLLMLRATSAGYPKSVRNSGLWLSFLLFVQFGLGVVGYKFNMPLWLTVAHTVSAPLLLLPLIALSFYSRYGGQQIPVQRDVSKLVPGVVERASDSEAIVTQPTEVLWPPAPEEEVYKEPEPESVFQRLKSQLNKTRSGLGGLIASLQLGQNGITEELLEDIEAQLLVADVGIDVTTKIINKLRQRLDRHQLADSAALNIALKEELLAILTPCSKPLHIPKQENPFVILVVGVNGVGKTTTIGKLAKRLSAQGHSVMLAAGDTFRAAAVEQLQVWGERNNIQVVAQQTGSDSASVIFDAIQSAQSKGVDVLIADTAGRLHTKSNLMEELKKVKRIMAKLDESAPHEVLLVLDAGTGQNALSQAKQFNLAIDLTGLVLTKLDGTAKGGVIFALAKQSGIPIRFIGVGEGIEDLQDFNAENFIDALFVEN